MVSHQHQGRISEDSASGKSTKWGPSLVSGIGIERETKKKKTNKNWVENRTRDSWKAEIRGNGMKQDGFWRSYEKRACELKVGEALAMADSEF